MSRGGGVRCIGMNLARVVEVGTAESLNRTCRSRCRCPSLRARGSCRCEEVGWRWWGSESTGKRAREDDGKIDDVDRRIDSAVDFEVAPDDDNSPAIPSRDTTMLWTGRILDVIGIVVLAT